MGWMVRGSNPSRGKIFILLSKTSRPDLGPTQLPNHWVPDYSPPPGVKRPEREAIHLPPPIAKVKNEWHCTSAPPYAVVAWTAITLSCCQE